MRVSPSPSSWETSFQGQRNKWQAGERWRMNELGDECNHHTKEICGGYAGSGAKQLAFPGLLVYNCKLQSQHAHPKPVCFPKAAHQCPTASVVRKTIRAHETVLGCQLGHSTSKAHPVQWFSPAAIRMCVSVQARRAGNKFGDLARSRRSRRTRSVRKTPSALPRIQSKTEACHMKCKRSNVRPPSNISSKSSSLGGLW